MDFHESTKVDSEKDYSGKNIFFYSFSYVFSMLNYLSDFSDLHSTVWKIKHTVHL